MSQKTKLRRSDVRLLLVGLRSLDGRPEVVKDGDGKYQGILTVPYKLSGPTRVAVARTLRAIQGVVDDTEADRTLLVETARQGVVPGPDGAYPYDPALDKQVADLLRQEVEVTIHRFPLADLNLERNDLAPTVLSYLLVALRDESDPG